MKWKMCICTLEDHALFFFSNKMRAKYLMTCGSVILVKINIDFFSVFTRKEKEGKAFQQNMKKKNCHSNAKYHFSIELSWRCCLNTEQKTAKCKITWIIQQSKWKANKHFPFELNWCWHCAFHFHSIYQVNSIAIRSKKGECECYNWFQKYFPLNLWHW